MIGSDRSNNNDWDRDVRADVIFYFKLQIMCLELEYAPMYNAIRMCVPNPSGNFY